MYLELSVEASKEANTDQNQKLGTTLLEASLQGATANGTSTTFASAIRIKLYKTPIQVIYPLNYVRVRRTVLSLFLKLFQNSSPNVFHQSVNGKPYELVLQVRIESHY